MDAFESSKALRNSFFSQHAHRLNARSVEGRHQYAVMAMEVAGVVLHDERTQKYGYST